jgi:hypothetical protein
MGAGCFYYKMQLAFILSKVLNKGAKKPGLAGQQIELI